jgi:hypothetical protein
MRADQTLGAEAQGTETKRRRIGRTDSRYARVYRCGSILRNLILQTPREVFLKQRLKGRKLVGVDVAGH